MTDAEIKTRYGSSQTNGEVIRNPFIQKSVVELPVYGNNKLRSRWTPVTAFNDQINSDASLDDDTELFVNVLCPGTYHFHTVVFLNSPDAAADYKYAMPFSGTASRFTNTTRTTTAGAVAGTDNEVTTITASTIASRSITATTGGLARIEVDEIIDVLTPGRYRFQFAMVTDTASNLTRIKGSYMEWLYAETHEPPSVG